MSKTGKPARKARPRKQTLPRPQPESGAPDYRNMIEQAAHGVFVHRDFRPLFANASFARLFGYDGAGDILAMPLIRPLIPAENWALLESSQDDLKRDAGNRPAMTRLRMLDRHGQEIALALMQRPVVWRGKAAVEWHVFDMSGQAKIEQQLLASEQRLRALLEILPYPIMIARRSDGRILFVNRKTCLLLAQSAGGLLKGVIADLFVDRKDQDGFLMMLDAIKDVRELEARLQAHGGRQFLAEIAALTIDYDGRQAVLIALNDISARKELEAELFHQASTDALTGISNRRYFLARGEQELRRSRRFARPLAVMMVDIDHFKRINDAYGHAGGDHVLQEIVKACSASLRGTDAMGRLGGEEFAVLMPETELQAAMEVAERLRAHIAGHAIAIGDKTVRCTVSIGIAALQPQDSNIDRLLHRADQALYQAKHDGRDRVVSGQ